MAEFVIRGGRRLQGAVRISGSKNAALPILAATLLTEQPCTIKNVPDIEDIRTMLAILRALGSEVAFKNNTVKIQTKRILQGKVPHGLGCRMRASVLLLGPLIARTGRANLPYPGGCVLGARPIDTHLDVFKKLGVKKIKSSKENVVLAGAPRPANFILSEFSVTATENALMASARTRGETVINLAALEPHVQDLCRFLEKLGVRVKGIGTHTLTIHGREKLRGAVHSVTADYLETGTLAIAAVLTKGRVTLRNIISRDLDVFWNLLKEMNVPLSISKNSVIIRPAKNLAACKRLQTMIFPGFPTDLQPPFAVLLTQAKGKSHIHETLFEGRFRYFPELIKMGASIQTINPHEAFLDGPTKLHGAEIRSWDIRAGATMILAGLVAQGTTVVKDIHYIDRGYERFDEKLRGLGADITRV